MDRAPHSHGTGAFTPADFRALGEGCVLEPGVLVFHAETITLGRRVYVGHQAILKGYYKGELRIGDGCWIGQQAFLHSAGGLTLGTNVGIGPGVKILTSQHTEPERGVPVLHAPLAFAPVIVHDDADVGTGAVILPGVTIGRGAIVGAGAVVTRDVDEYAVVAGNPARPLRQR